jgi:plastocyanin
MRPRLVLIAAAAASLAAAGCGEPRGAATRTVPEPLGPVATTDARAVATAEVSLVDYALHSSDPRVPRAGLVAFEATNDGLVRHALAVDGPAGQVRTPTLSPGERATITVPLPPGTYKWYCPLDDHEARGMVGRVRVAE